MNSSCVYAMYSSMSTNTFEPFRRSSIEKRNGGLEKTLEVYKHFGTLPLVIDRYKSGEFVILRHVNMANTRVSSVCRAIFMTSNYIDIIIHFFYHTFYVQNET